MKKHLQVLITIVGIAAAYFGAVYFAAAALLPELALTAALLAMILSLLAYRLLGITGDDEEGLPYGLLFLMPFVCIMAGMIWWIIRWLGLWQIR